MSSSPDPGNNLWYIAQLKPNGLNLALRNLARQRFGTFVPMETRTVRRAGHFRTGSFPVFPGYVFTAIDPRQGRWRAVNSTTGVARLVSFGSAPVVVAPALIEALMRRYGGDEHPAAIEVAPGDLVEIADGPFAEFVARVEAVSPEHRVHLLIDLLGRETRMSVEPSRLRRAG